MEQSTNSKKAKVIFLSRGRIIFLFEEGPFAGQTIQWFGEPDINNKFYLRPFSAYQIRPVTKEQMRFLLQKGTEIIRELEKDEYPVLMKELEENCDYQTRCDGFVYV